MALAAQPACPAGRARCAPPAPRPSASTSSLPNLRPTAADDAALAAALGPDVVLAGDETLIETPQADQTHAGRAAGRIDRAGARPGIASVASTATARCGGCRAMPTVLPRTARPVGRHRRSRRAGRPLIQSFGPARTYPTVSYYQALDPDAFPAGRHFSAAASCSSASVLQIGAGGRAGGADAFATPFTVHTGHLIAGRRDPGDDLRQYRRAAC